MYRFYANTPPVIRGLTVPALVAFLTVVIKYLKEQFEQERVYLDHSLRLHHDWEDVAAEV